MLKTKTTFVLNKLYVLFAQYSLLYQNKNAREDVNLWITLSPTGRLLIAADFKLMTADKASKLSF
jgi:hypothetical protein